MYVGGGGSKGRDSPGRGAGSGQARPAGTVSGEHSIPTIVLESTPPAWSEGGSRTSGRWGMRMSSRSGGGNNGDVLVA